ncbi:MAG: type II toxin-antitoxin system YafQ family toxin [Tannerellaceae bacterium]
MKELRYTTKAKKDLKKYRHKPHKLQKLYEVLEFLVQGRELPDYYLPHKLIGEYQGCMECHVEGNFLLIWIDLDYIEIIRIGTHSELF